MAKFAFLAAFREFLDLCFALSPSPKSVVKAAFFLPESLRRPTGATVQRVVDSEPAPPKQETRTVTTGAWA